MAIDLLKSINSPSDLKKLSIDELDNYSVQLSSFIDKTVSSIGGHYSSPLGVVDLSIALHYVYNSPKDKLVWDVGHQAYAHKIITGRRDRFDTLRKKEGISGFLKRNESAHDIFGAGHASTSISAALGIAHARDLKKENFQVLSIIGDGSMTGGLAYEGINNLGYHKTQLTVVLNDNSMSISKSVGALSHYLTKIITNPTYNKIRNDIWDISGKLPFGSKSIRRFLRKTQMGIKNYITPGSLFEDLGLRYIGPVDGHNIIDLIKVFKSVKDMNSPVLVHVLTSKGKGNDLAEKDSVKYYSVSGEKSSSSDGIGFSNVFGDSMCDIAKENSNVMCITAAMEKGTGMSEFVAKYPDNYIDVGIAEEHAITYGAGLACENIVPVVALYSTFAQRAYDQIFHDVSLQELPMVICLDRSGVVGPDGPTHHGVFDISILRSLPNIVISSPANGSELRNLIYTAINSKKLFIIRYPKSNTVEYDKSLPFITYDIGRWSIINPGEKILILSTGPLYYEIIDNINYIKQNLGYEPTIVHARFIKPMDAKMLIDLSSSHDTIITVEEGTEIGGFGSGILEFISKNYININVENIAIPDTYIEHASRSEQLDEIGLSGKRIADNIISVGNSISKNKTLTKIVSLSKDVD